jgi:hypothetical protein
MIAGHYLQAQLNTQEAAKQIPDIGNAGGHYLQHLN